MSTDLGRSTVECPACGQPLDIPIVGRTDEDDRATVWVEADLSGVRAHAQEHEGQAGGRGEARGVGQAFGR